MQTEDLLKFGLIPEFIGRLPVIATLDELDEEDLVRILQGAEERADASVPEALRDGGCAPQVHRWWRSMAIAREALRRKSGARGLRAILEDTMLDVMYDIPSQPNIKEVLIAEEVITKHEQPIVLYQKTAETA